MPFSADTHDLGQNPVGVMRDDKQVLKEWSTDTDLDVLQVKRRRLEEERAHLFPHVPLIEGVLEKALDPEVEIKVISHTLIHTMTSSSRR